MIAMFNGKPIINSGATINGVNTLEIRAGDGISISQDENILTISASGGGGGIFPLMKLF